MIFNFPIDVFDKGLDPNPETLGFYLANIGQVPKANDLKFFDLFKYVKIVFETIMDAQAINFQKDPEQKKRTIVIDDLGFSPTNFNLCKAQEEALYQSGIKYAREYLEKNKPKSMIANK